MDDQNDQQDNQDPQDDQEMQETRTGKMPVYDNLRIHMVHGDTSKTAAFVSCKILTEAGALFLNSMALVRGANGLYLSFPSRKRDGQPVKGFEDYYYMERGLKEMIQAAAIDEFKKKCEEVGIDPEKATAPLAPGMGGEEEDYQPPRDFQPREFQPRQNTFSNDRGTRSGGSGGGYNGGDRGGFQGGSGYGGGDRGGRSGGGAYQGGGDRGGFQGGGSNGGGYGGGDRGGRSGGGYQGGGDRGGFQGGGGGFAGGDRGGRSSGGGYQGGGDRNSGGYGANRGGGYGGGGERNFNNSNSAGGYGSTNRSSYGSNSFQGPMAGPGQSSRPPLSNRFNPYTGMDSLIPDKGNEAPRKTPPPAVNSEE